MSASIIPRVDVNIPMPVVRNQSDYKIYYVVVIDHGPVGLSDEHIPKVLKAFRPVVAKSKEAARIKILRDLDGKHDLDRIEVIIPLTATLKG